MGKMSMWQTFASDTAGLQPGHGEDERDVERGVVGEIAVGRFAVLAQGFAVVGREDDDGPVPEPPVRRGSRGASPGPNRRRRLRRRRDVSRISGLERLGRLVGLVGIEADGPRGTTAPSGLRAIPGPCRRRPPPSVSTKVMSVGPWLP